MNKHLITRLHLERVILSILVLTGSYTIGLANDDYAAPAPVNECTPTVLSHWNMDACYAGWYYSEFRPEVGEENSCLEVNASKAKRRYGKHYCTPGEEGGKAMSIGTQRSCNPNHFQGKWALRFRVTVDPETTGQLTVLQFKQKASDYFYFTGVAGGYGMNNYPQKYMLKVRKNGRIIYEEDDISTSRNWSDEYFDFSDLSDFQVEERTTFTFQLRPYCRVGNGAYYTFWDIDEIEVGGCCTAPVSSDPCDEAIAGGLIEVNPDAQGSGYVLIENFGGGNTNDEDDDNEYDDDDGDDEIESVWLHSTNSDLDDALAELSGRNVGAIYNSFLSRGGFEADANPEIPGTSWEFVTDNDGDDLQLVVMEEPSETECYVRCVRNTSCESFHGSSNGVTVSPISTPITYAACNNTLTINLPNDSVRASIQIHTADYTETVFECNTYDNSVCTQLDDIELADGDYTLHIVLFDESFEEIYSMTELVNMPGECTQPLVAGTNPVNAEERFGRIQEAEAEAPITAALVAFPNPAVKNINFRTSLFGNKPTAISIYNNLGQQVYTRYFNRVKEQVINVDVSDYQTGLYYAVIQIEGEEEISRKFIVNGRNN